jgi:hypothetical protein
MSGRKSHVLGTPLVQRTHSAPGEVQWRVVVLRKAFIGREP